MREMMAKAAKIQASAMTELKVAASSTTSKQTAELTSSNLKNASSFTSLSHDDAPMRAGPAGAAGGDDLNTANQNMTKLDDLINKRVSSAQKTAKEQEEVSFII